MARIDPLPLDTLGELADQLTWMEKEMGFMPNGFPTMARVPGLPEAFQAMGRAVMMNGLITPELLTMVAHVASTASGCRYCQAHTGYGAEQLGVSAEKLATVWEFETSDLFDDAERAALRLAFHGGAVPNLVTDADIANAREHFTDDQITAIVAVISTMGFLNRWNDTMATELEDVPASFGDRVLTHRGWEIGKHAPTGTG